MKALVYRMGGLGDSILVYPILEVLTKIGYFVTVWGNPEYFRLAEIARFCVKTIFYQPAENYDFKIIFSKHTEIFKDNTHHSIYVNPIPNQQTWIVDYYLKEVGFKNEVFSQILPLPFSEAKINNLCIIHPGSGSKKKNPEVIFFFEVEKILKEAGYDIVYLLGPAESELRTVLRNSIYIENSFELAKTLLKASLYIGLDSGISHLSSYLGIPSIIIYGPTDPQVWHPIGKNFSIIRYKNCQPCFPNVCQERRCLEVKFLINKFKEYVENLKIHP